MAPNIYLMLATLIPLLISMGIKLSTMDNGDLHLAVVASPAIWSIPFMVVVSVDSICWVFEAYYHMSVDD